MAEFDRPTVSIVIPAYNQGQFLNEAIQSVLQQSYAPVELIVLDDGSNDETREVLANYGSQFRWESHANIGQAATLNKGWSMARGEIVGYLSADDLLHKNSVDRSVEILRSSPDAVLSYGDFDYIDVRGKALATVKTPPFDYADMLLKGVCPPGPGAFFRRQAFERLGGWDVTLRRMPDYEFWLRLGLLGPFVRIPEVLASYRIHQASQSFSPIDGERAEEMTRIVDQIYSHPELPIGLRSRKRYAYANALLYVARLHLYSGRTGIGLARAASAIRMCPAILVNPLAWRLVASGLLGRSGQKILWKLSGRA